MDNRKYYGRKEAKRNGNYYSETFAIEGITFKLKDEPNYDAVLQEVILEVIQGSGDFIKVIYDQEKGEVSMDEIKSIVKLSDKQYNQIKENIEQRFINKDFGD